MTRERALNELAKINCRLFGLLVDSSIKSKSTKITALTAGDLRRLRACHTMMNGVIFGKES